MSRAVIYKVYPDHPEASKIAKIAWAFADGALALYPTDTVYGLGCDPRNKNAVERLRMIKTAPSQKLLTLLCPSLAEISAYAYVDDAAFKLMRSLTPGPYTFILKGTKEVPRLVLDPRRRTVGLRVPDHPVCQAVMERLSGLLVTTSAKLPPSAEAKTREELFARFENLVDVIIDDRSPLRHTPSTIIDLTQPEFEIIREGQGMEAMAPFLK